MATNLPYKNIHRIMKESTNLKIGQDSVEQNKYFIEELIKQTTRIAATYTNYRGSKTINSNDINLAINDLLKGGN